MEADLIHSEPQLLKLCKHGKRRTLTSSLMKVLQLETTELGTKRLNCFGTRRLNCLGTKRSSWVRNDRTYETTGDRFGVA